MPPRSFSEPQNEVSLFWLINSRKLKYRPFIIAEDKDSLRMFSFERLEAVNFFYLAEKWLVDYENCRLIFKYFTYLLIS